MHKLLVNSIIILITIQVFGVFGQKHDDVTLFSWNLLNFNFPSPRERQEAISSGNFDVNNCIPIDVQPYLASHHNPSVFTTIPRFSTGIPYTLATVQITNSGPQLNPYPDYNWHSSHGRNCDGITSAFRVAINDCKQMWVIDSGVIGSEQLCPPQLLLFDLMTDQLVHRFRFNTTTTPPLYIPTASLFITPILFEKDATNCRRTMVYVADVSYHGLVVYDYEQNTAWRVENKYMYPNPEFGTHTIAGENFTLMDGIFGLSTNKRNLYFHPLASSTEYSVPLSVLNNRDNWSSDVNSMPNEFQIAGIRRSPCATEAMDSRGNLFCVTFNPIQLMYWNTRERYFDKYTRKLAVNPRYLEFVSGMKVVKNRYAREELWLISNRFQKVASGTLNSNEINFRILKVDISNIDETRHTHSDLNNRLVFS